jgi:putative ABC transport system permease protein
MNFKVNEILKNEKLLLMVVSTLIGLIPAVLSVLPILMSSLYFNIRIWLPGISVLVILSGALFSFVAIRMAFRQSFYSTMRSV